MNTRHLIVAALVSLATGFVSAQTPATGPAPSAAEKEKLCQANPEKCAQIKDRNRMQQAMQEACEKNPAGCAERREKAAKRHNEKQRPQ